jgi:hypothetical protein
MIRVSILAHKIHVASELMIDTNNLLTLFTQMYSNKEVLEKVVVIKMDRFSW